MTDSSGLFGSNEFHAHFFSTLRQMAEYPLTVAFLVIILALIGVSSPLVSIDSRLEEDPNVRLDDRLVPDGFGAAASKRIKLSRHAT